MVLRRNQNEKHQQTAWRRENAGCQSAICLTKDCTIFGRPIRAQSKTKPMQFRITFAIRLIITF